MRRTHTLIQWDGNLDRVDSLEQLAQALDQWQHWANGDAVSPDAMSKAVAVLRHSGVLQTERNDVIATVDRSVVARRVQPQLTPRLPVVRQPDMGIEL